MIRARVPEAAVDEDRDAGPCEDDVGPHCEFVGADQEVLSEPQARLV